MTPTSIAAALAPVSDGIRSLPAPKIQVAGTPTWSVTSVERATDTRLGDTGFGQRGLPLVEEISSSETLSALVAANNLSQLT